MAASPPGIREILDTSFEVRPGTGTSSLPARVLLDLINVTGQIRVDDVQNGRIEGGPRPQRAEADREQLSDATFDWAPGYGSGRAPEEGYPDEDPLEQANGCDSEGDAPQRPSRCA